MEQRLPPEVWLRGPLPGIPALLQPAAHAILQATEEIDRYLSGFDESLLWERPAGLASVAFHLKHMVGILDRLFTYARGEVLTREQLDYLSAEGTRTSEDTKVSMLARLHTQVAKAIGQLAATDESTLTESRFVGRKQIPSTTIGLLFHTAEHMQRHTGQLLVTTRVLAPILPTG